MLPVSGGSAGSVAEYFINQSDSLFRPEFTVIGPVTLSKSYSYYGQNRGNITDSNIGTFFTESCQLAMNMHSTDWSSFDNNSDGVTDFVFFIYAGYGENDSSHDDPNTIWPKESASHYTVSLPDLTLTFGGYGCTNELYAGTQDGIGTACHELSHALGLPDFYNEAGNAFGLDYWDIMDSGSYQMDGTEPCCYSAYERDFMKWRKLTTIPYDTIATLTLLPMELPPAQAYKIQNPANKREYFILENRQNIGFDSHLGCKKTYYPEMYGTAHGLLISHIDYNPTAWSNNYAINADPDHQRLTLVPADGRLTMSPTTDEQDYALSLRGDTYPGLFNISEMSSYAVFTGGSIGMSITDITEHTDGSITLKINGGSPDAITTPAIHNTFPNGEKPIFDLYGRFVGTRMENLHRGTYIIDGKKVFVSNPV